MAEKCLTRRAALGLLLSGLAAGGCGKGRDGNSVTGTVSVGDRILTSGTVLFVDASGKVVRTAIGPKGNYRVTGLAEGPAKVAVVGHARVPAGLQRSEKEGLGGGSVRPAADDGPAIPTRYTDPEKSGLTYDVQPGEQEHHIRLTP